MHAQLILLIDDLSLVKPTVMLAVPRIFEKIHTRIQNQIKDGLKAQKRIF
jgi:long-subunit acyl-CoA synthetase (AMP-forming)